MIPASASNQLYSYRCIAIHMPKGHHKLSTHNCTINYKTTKGFHILKLLSNQHMKLIPFDMFTTDSCFFLSNIICAYPPEDIHSVIETCREADCTCKSTACGMPTGAVCVIRMDTQAALWQRCIRKLEIKFNLPILGSSLPIMTFPEGGGRKCIRNRSLVFQTEGTNNSIKIV
jgi:hypothetical protein